MFNIFCFLYFSIFSLIFEVCRFYLLCYEGLQSYIKIIPSHSQFRPQTENNKTFEKYCLSQNLLFIKVWYFGHAFKLTSHFNPLFQDGRWCIESPCLYLAISITRFYLTISIYWTKKSYTQKYFDFLTGEGQKKLRGEGQIDCRRKNRFDCRNSRFDRPVNSQETWDHSTKKFYLKTAKIFESIRKWGYDGKGLTKTLRKVVWSVHNGRLVSFSGSFWYFNFRNFVYFWIFCIVRICLCFFAYLFLFRGFGILFVRCPWTGQGLYLLYICFPCAVGVGQVPNSFVQHFQSEPELHQNAARFHLKPTKRLH